MKLKILLATLILIAPQLSQAQNQWSAGLGYQYGGLIGGQYGYIDGDNKYYVSFGLVGAALGFERAISANKKHTLGVTSGINELSAEDGFLHFTYNYHFNELALNGFQIGVSAGIRREDEAGFLGDRGPTNSYNSLGISVAYKF